MAWLGYPLTSSWQAWNVSPHLSQVSTLMHGGRGFVCVLLYSREKNEGGDVLQKGQLEGSSAPTGMLDCRLSCSINVGIFFFEEMVFWQGTQMLLKQVEQVTAATLSSHRRHFFSSQG